MLTLFLPVRGGRLKRKSVKREAKRAEQNRLVFTFFNEIGILAQLSRARFERQLPDGVSVPHFSVLNHLVRLGDGKSPLALAKAFQVSKANMTNTLAGLERRNLIAYQPHPSDGRSKLVHLTKAGRTFRDRAIDLMQPEIAQVVSRFDVDKLAKILPVLQSLREVMDRYRDE